MRLYKAVRSDLNESSFLLGTYRDSTANYGHDWLRLTPHSFNTFSHDIGKDVLHTYTTERERDKNLFLPICGGPFLQPARGSNNRDGSKHCGHEIYMDQNLGKNIGVETGPAWGGLPYDLYNAIIETKREIDISTLSLCFEDEMFAVLKRAVLALAKKNGKRKAQEWPRVRIIYGMVCRSKISATSSTFIRNQITDRNELQGVHLYVGYLANGFANVTSWNHTKMIARDAWFVWTGGQNLWGVDYLRSQTVFDVNMKGAGDIGIAAQSLQDILWHKVKEGGSWAKGTQDPDPTKYLGASYPDATENKSYAHTEVPTISAANFIKDTWVNNHTGGQYYGPEIHRAADKSIDTLFKNAKKSIKILNQDLYAHAALGTNSNGFDNVLPTGLDGMAQALIENPKLEIHILKSDPEESLGKGYNNYSSKETALWLGRQLFAKLYNIQKKLIGEYAPNGRLSVSTDCPRPRTIDFCRRVKVKRFSRMTSNGWAYPKLHSKVVIVDDAAIVIGSNNLYSNPLIEHQFLVFNESMTSKLLDSTWNDPWSNTEAPTYDACEKDQPLIATVTSYERLQSLTSICDNTKTPGY